MTTTKLLASALLFVLASSSVASAFAPSPHFATRPLVCLSDSSDDAVTFDAFVPGETKELATKDEVVGDGEEAKEGQMLTVSFKGRMMKSGVEQDVDKFSFKLGEDGSVMEGWQQGLPGMKVGGKRLLRIPAGELTKGGGGEDLEFEVELLSVTEGAFNEFLVKNGLGANAKTYGIIALIIISAILPQLQKAGIIT